MDTGFFFEGDLLTPSLRIEIKGGHEDVLTADLMGASFGSGGDILVTETKRYEGRVVTTELRLRDAKGTNHVPMSKIQSLSFKRPVGNGVIETRDGTKLSGPVSPASLKVSGDVGELDLPLAKIQEIYVREDLTILTKAGSLQVKPVTAELTIKSEVGDVKLPWDKIKSVTFNAWVPPPTRLVDPGLEPRAIIKLGAKMPDFFLSRDRKWLHLLNASGTKVQRIDVVKGTLDETSAEIAAFSKAMCVGPDGTLYVCSGPAAGSGDPKTPGKIQIVDPKTMKLAATFGIEFDPLDLEADDKGHLVVTCASGQHPPLAVVDIAKQSLLTTWGSVSPGTVLQATTDRRHFYFSAPNGTWLQGMALTDGFPKVLPSMYTAKDAKGNGERFFITPDAKFLITPKGDVTALAKNEKDDLKPAAKIAAHTAIAICGNDALYVATQAGELHRYTYPAFKLERTHKLRGVVTQMICDGTTFYCAFEPGKRATEWVKTPVDIHIYELKDK